MPVSSKIRPTALECIFIIVIGLILYWMVGNFIAQVNAKNIQLGFSFLQERAGFDISETLPLPLHWDRTSNALLWQWESYSAESSYWAAFAMGIFNTLKVGIAGSLFASVIGFLTALLMVSKSSPFYLLGTFYIRLTRSVPLLLQLLLWYTLFVSTIPDVEHSFQFGNSAYLNNRGLSIPWWVLNDAGQFVWESPEKVFGGRNLRGGITFSPEFVSLLFGLAIYTGSYIADLLRAALASLPKGQTEAGISLGLSRLQVFRCVLLPQAWKIAVPPLVSQYLNLLKNSSLAVAIGYPDFMSIGGTMINQSGHTLEIVAAWITVYLSFSILTSALIQLWNRNSGQPSKAR